MQITTAAQAAQRDADAIASGIDAWTLMLNAGSAAASLIMSSYSQRLSAGAVVYAGSGNNGGDAYVIAARFIENGIRTALIAVGEPRTPGAQRAKAFLDAAIASSAKSGNPSVVLAANATDACQLIVDGILGTGQTGELRVAERGAARAINTRCEVATIVALDVPTGVDATSGAVASDAVRAHHTIAFGTMKRAHVLQRAQVGRVTVVDIGLGAFAEKEDGAWTLADHAMVRHSLPAIEWNAFKGTRGKLALVGGADGMAGAVVLASRAALRAGAGLVYAHTSPNSTTALQIAVPQVVARLWTDMPEGVRAAAIGPGLGRDSKSRHALGALLDATSGIPTVLDADALTLLATHAETANDDLDEELSNLSNAEQTIARLQHIASNRPVVCTPHVGEFARLIDRTVAETIEGRVQQATDFARATEAVILLKGTPTVVVSSNGSAPVVVPRGTAVLGTGGSGDLLTGLIGALLGQGASPRDAAVVGAWVHGRAAEIATERAATIRGVTLDEVLAALVEVWRELEHDATLPANLLAELPDIAL